MLVRAIEINPFWVWMPGLGTFDTIAEAYAAIAAKPS